ncbi:hypothetical protein GM418_17750 [Maribellus comscasis]|uniref:DNA polymerase III subunit gamma/tau n=1 Tax=Maribellus comscasis TaxID=2681766 RepID=A0A6I6JVX3_9BACT|nr:hypothetical protein [Maribellus comscasis]QGY45449.1 hypothetical protein GM418_17750 [Maribellus comscasis]
MLEPIFSEIKESSKQEGSKSEARQVPKRPEPSQNSRPRKIAKRASRSTGVPSIKDALQGKFEEDQISAKEQHQIYNQSDEKEDFSEEALQQKWEQFTARFDDRPNLKSTLSRLPQIQENYSLLLEIENTVQENLINSIKPELVSWLRKELKNSHIQLVTKITETIKGRIIYTDSEKFDEMVKKNPQLAVLKQKFNLDFGG